MNLCSSVHSEIQWQLNDTNRYRSLSRTPAVWINHYIILCHGYRTSSWGSMHSTQVLHSIHCHGYVLMMGIISSVSSAHDGWPVNQKHVYHYSDIISCSIVGSRRLLSLESEFTGYDTWLSQTFTSIMRPTILYNHFTTTITITTVIVTFFWLFPVVTKFW